ncbi:hypothetical protein Tco_0979917 [Tanacetum coccineum]
MMVDTTAEATSSIYIDQDTPSPSTSLNTKTISTPIQDANEPNQKNEDAEFDSDTFTNLFAPPDTSNAESSSSRIYARRHPVCRLMLDRTDFESWQQRIRLYCLEKDNGENIMKSIKEGPFHIGTVSDVITGGTEGA